MSGSMTAVVDLDAFKYAVAFAGEKRKVIITHKTNGESFECATRTEWYGRGKAKDKGKLAEINAKRESPYTWDEFTYEDVRTVEPIENILHTAKQNVQRVVKASGAKTAQYFIGKGESFRVELSTLIKYKDRDDLVKPVMLDDVVEYMTKKFKAEVIEGYEVDDVITMETWKKPNKFVIIEDKDAYGSGVKVYNFNKPEEGIIDTNCFGELWIDEKSNVRGFGRMFKLWQVCHGDSVDNYKSNCFSDLEWGAKSAYHALVDCKDDKELFEQSLKVFQTLYPEPKVVKGWKGNEFEIDALYVMQEMMDMAHMHRWQNDFVNVKEVMDKLGVKYD